MLMMTSCYTSQVLVGNVKKNQPLVYVAQTKNHFFIYGLIPLESQDVAGKLVGTRRNYVIETTHSFADVLLEIVTGGIYTPTTTKYYLPVVNQ
ncbi:hypothetical protein AGMMS49574_18330 [Bacteroidia bacterium]|nr:hypothetical protein AGMMS49574_18330 [Bacteroidia bacterium]